MAKRSNRFVPATSRRTDVERARRLLLNRAADVGQGIAVLTPFDSGIAEAVEQTIAEAQEAEPETDDDDETDF